MSVRTYKPSKLKKQQHQKKSKKHPIAVAALRGRVKVVQCLCERMHGSTEHTRALEYAAKAVDCTEAHVQCVNILAEGMLVHAGVSGATDAASIRCVTAAMFAAIAQGNYQTLNAICNHVDVLDGCRQQLNSSNRGTRTRTKARAQTRPTISEPVESTWASVLKEKNRNGDSVLLASCRTSSSSSFSCQEDAIACVQVLLQGRSFLCRLLYSDESDVDHATALTACLFSGGRLNYNIANLLLKQAVCSRDHHHCALLDVPNNKNQLPLMWLIKRTQKCLSVETRKYCIEGIAFLIAAGATITNLLVGLLDSAVFNSQINKKTNRTAITAALSMLYRKDNDLNRWWQPKQMTNTDMESYVIESGVERDLSLTIVSSAAETSSSSFVMDKPFVVHQCVVLSSVDFFASLLTVGMRESQERVLRLNYSGQCISMLLDFIYWKKLFVPLVPQVPQTASVDTNTQQQCSNVDGSHLTVLLLELQALAHYLMYEQLMVVVSAVLGKRLTPQTVMQVMEQSLQFQESALTVECRRFVVKNYIHVVEAWKDCEEGSGESESGEDDEGMAPAGRELLVYVLLMED
jgi:hypothetical protein